MVSEHASPLAAVGGVDAGGQNVHVLELGTALAAAGHEVTVWTRRDADRTPDTVTLRPRADGAHGDRGPAGAGAQGRARALPPAFARMLGADWAARRPDVVHAHFWMSGMAAVSAAAPLGLPVVQTFHALGSVKRRHQGADDTSPPGRVAAERAVAGRVDRVIATCTDEVFELARLGAPRRRDDGRAVRGRHGRVLARRPGASALGAAPDRRAGPPRPAQGRRRGDRGAAPAARRRAARRGRAGRVRLVGRRAGPRPGRAAAAARGGRGGRRGPGPAARRGRPAGRAGPAALRGRGGVRALVRAVRDRAARGHGLRAPRGRERGRRHPGHRRGPGHRPARAPAPARRAGGGAADPARRTHAGAGVRHRRPRPRAGPLRLGPHRRGDRRGVRGRAGGAGGGRPSGPAEEQSAERDDFRGDGSTVLGVAR